MTGNNRPIRIIRHYRLSIAVPIRVNISRASRHLRIVGFAVRELLIPRRAWVEPGSDMRWRRLRRCSGHRDGQEGRGRSCFGAGGRRGRRACALLMPLSDGSAATWYSHGPVQAPEPGCKVTGVDRRRESVRQVAEIQVSTSHGRVSKFIPQLEDRDAAIHQATAHYLSRYRHRHSVDMVGGGDGWGERARVQDEVETRAHSDANAGGIVWHDKDGHGGIWWWRKGQMVRPHLGGLWQEKGEGREGVKVECGA
ncbi:hypothetical protein OH77DRAFT_1257558 [Trametes cingulata]|nr:hypothetical protein OH77DRAFT_1257558 [Trametes cingulata]